MVEEGVLENPRVDAIFATHVFPLLPVGKVGVYEREGLRQRTGSTLRSSEKGDTVPFLISVKIRSWQQAISLHSFIPLSPAHES